MRTNYSLNLGADEEWSIERHSMRAALLHKLTALSIFFLPINILISSAPSSLSLCICICAVGSDSLTAFQNLALHDWRQDKRSASALTVGALGKPSIKVVLCKNLIRLTSKSEVHDPLISSHWVAIYILVGDVMVMSDIQQRERHMKSIRGRPCLKIRADWERNRASSNEYKLIACENSK